MDHLFLNDIAFPVERGVLYQGREELGDYRWEVEVYCGESPQLDYRNWPDNRVETPDDFLAGTGVMLGAQRLPLRVRSPDELVGREYLFPPTPEPDPSEWQAADPCWPYFFLYVWEGCPTEQLRVAFTAKRGRQYRVEIAGRYTDGGASYSLRVQAWLDWQGADAESVVRRQEGDAVAEASEVLRGELLAVLAAAAPRLCDGLRAELARPHPEQPGRPLQFEADPWSWGITSTATEEPVIDGEGLEGELPADWFERCEAAGVNWDAMLSDEICP